MLAVWAGHRLYVANEKRKEVEIELSSAKKELEDLQAQEAALREAIKSLRAEKNEPNLKPNEKPEQEDIENRPDRSTLPISPVLAADKQQPNILAATGGVNANTQTNDQKRPRRCFIDEDLMPTHSPKLARFPLDLDNPPLSRSNNRPESFNVSLSENLRGSGNTPEQEARLLRIYESIPSRQTPELNAPHREGIDIAAQAYHQFMGNRAVKEGREGQDRAVDPDRALNVDRDAFASLLELEGVDETTAFQTLVDFSPTAADLSPDEQKVYKETIGGLWEERVNTLEMDKGRDGSVSSISTSGVAYGIGKPGVDRTPSDLKEERLFDAERTDLIARPYPGAPLPAKLEYQRELGALIREFGREGLAFREDECEEDGRTVDQYIAATMSIGGYKALNIEEAIANASPKTAGLLDKEVQHYLDSQIEPVFSDPEVTANFKAVEEMRDDYQIPSNIQRGDCVELVLQAIPDKQWNPKNPAETCPGYPDSPTAPKREPELEPLLEP